MDTSHVIVDPALRTGLGIALCRHDDRAILTYLGSLCAVQIEDISDAFLASARHLHHGSYFLHTSLRGHVPSLLDRAHRFGLTTSLDTNWDPEERWNATLADALPRTDILLPNEQEALLISRQPDLEGAMSHFHSAGVPLVAVKRGTQGALASAGQQTHICQVPPRRAVTALTPGFSLAGCVGCRHPSHSPSHLASPPHIEPRRGDHDAAPWSADGIGPSLRLVL